MFKKLVVSAVLATLTLCAAEVKESGFYLGAGIGGTGFSDSDMVKEQYGSTYVFENSSGGVALYGGYKVNNIFAFEMGYHHYGTFQIRQPALGSKRDYSPSSFSASANLGYGFLDGQLRPYILLGLSSIDLDGWVTDDKGVGSHIGFGIQYDPEELNGFGFRLGYEGDGFTVKTATKDYAQGLGILYIGAHYLF